MNRLKRLGLAVPVFVLVAILAMGASSCDPNAATTSSMCAFVIGDGQDGHNAAIHEIVYPNEQVHVGGDEVVKYVPCNSRNFIIGKRVTNANGQVVGDRAEPTIAYTKNGTKVNIFTSSYWTLNQDQAALTKFWDVCSKYICYSNEPKAGGANFSEPGWNGMLGENFGPSVDEAAFNETAKFDDEIWQKHTPALYKKLGLFMSDAFSEAVRTKTGYNSDLFCGSGNSVWTGDPGDSTFTCRNVRIEVNDVEPFDAKLGDTTDAGTQAQQDRSVNVKKLQAAKELYGAQAGYWLGLQETIAKCKAQVTCIVNIGGSGTAGVSVPVTPNR